MCRVFPLLDPLAGLRDLWRGPSWFAAHVLNVGCPLHSHRAPSSREVHTTPYELSGYPMSRTRMLCISSTLILTCSTTLPYSTPVGTYRPPRSCCNSL